MCSSDFFSVVCIEYKVKIYLSPVKLMCQWAELNGFIRCKTRSLPVTQIPLCIIQVVFEKCEKWRNYFCSLDFWISTMTYIVPTCTIWVSTNVDMILPWCLLSNRLMWWTLISLKPEFCLRQIKNTL